MGKGGGKGAGAKAAKASHEEKVNAQKQKQLEDAEAAKWADGSKEKKASKLDKEEKAAAAKAAKAERDRQLKEEEKEANKTSTKAATKAGKPPPHKVASNSGPSTIPQYAARNIDDILDLLDLANDDEDKASMGAKAAKDVDPHPERRFKAAFEAYKEKELPQVKKEHPGLRLQQYNDILHKQFKKHPDNPFNQLTVAYDATKEEKVAALKAKKKETEERLKAG